MVELDSISNLSKFNSKFEKGTDYDFQLKITDYETIEYFEFGGYDSIMSLNISKLSNGKIFNENFHDLVLPDDYSYLFLIIGYDSEIEEFENGKDILKILAQNFLNHELLTISASLLESSVKIGMLDFRNENFEDDNEGCYDVLDEDEETEKDEEKVDEIDGIKFKIGKRGTLINLEPSNVVTLQINEDQFNNDRYIFRLNEGIDFNDYKAYLHGHNDQPLVTYHGHNADDDLFIYDKKEKRFYGWNIEKAKKILYFEDLYDPESLYHCINDNIDYIIKRFEKFKGPLILTDISIKWNSIFKDPKMNEFYENITGNISDDYYERSDNDTWNDLPDYEDKYSNENE